MAGRGGLTQADALLAKVGLDFDVALDDLDQVSVAGVDLRQFEDECYHFLVVSEQILEWLGVLLGELFCNEASDFGVFQF